MGILNNKFHAYLFAIALNVVFMISGLTAIPIGKKYNRVTLVRIGYISLFTVLFATGLTSMSD